MSNDIKVYLAGAMTEYAEQGRFDIALEWRRYATQRLNELGYKVFNPTNIVDSELKAFDDRTIDKSIVVQNDYYLERADIILVDLMAINKSIGTLYEVFTSYKANKPVVCFNRSRKTPTHPHLNQSMTYVADTLEEAITHIVRFYKPFE